MNSSASGAPPGVIAVPLVLSVTEPTPTASNNIAASNPAPAAPVGSFIRVAVKSTRPAAVSTCWVNVTCTPPCRRKLPSCTVRTRRTFGSKNSVSEMVDSWDTPVIEIGTV